MPLAALVFFSFCCIFALLSFYYAKTAIDDEGLVHIWRIVFALLLLVIAHVSGYLSLSIWGL